MITQIIKVNSPERIQLGRREENEATEIIFDVTYFTETFGDGTAVLLAKRSQDANAYPVAVTQDDNKVTWLVSNADTAYEGQGKAELQWFVGEVLAKSVVFRTWVDPDIGEEGEVPEPYESWVTKLIDDMDEKMSAAQDAASSASRSAEEAAALVGSMVFIGPDGKLYYNS